MAAEIEHTDYFNRTDVCTAEVFARRTLVDHDDYQRTALNAVEALGRMVDALVDRQVITSDEAKRLLRGY